MISREDHDSSELEKKIVTCKDFIWEENELPRVFLVNHDLRKMEKHEETGQGKNDLT